MSQTAEKLRDHAIVEAATNRLREKRRHAEIATVAVTSAVTDRDQAFDAHRDAMLNGAETKATAEAHAAACHRVQLAEQIQAHVVAQEAAVEADLIFARAESYEPVLREGMRLRIEAADQADKLRAQLEQLRSDYIAGTNLVQAAHGGGYKRPVGVLPGLVLQGPGMPPRLPTKLEELERWEGIW